MKKTITNTIKWQLRWLSLVAIMLLAFLPEAKACQRFYYHVTVTPTPQGAGKVYGNSEATANPNYQNSSSQDGEGWGIIGNGASSTYHLYAQPNENFLFDHWEDGSGNNVSSSPQYNPTIQYNGARFLGAWTTPRTQINFTAVFKEQTGLVKVKSANETLGSVDISNIDNKIGDEVTLSAFPDVSNGVMFLGWTYGTDVNNTDYVSHENPWTFTVTDDNKGWYVAHFSEPAEKVYVRLQNKKTGRFISFYGNATATAHNRTYKGNTIQDGFNFTGSLKMLDAAAAQGNPETVFMRSGHSVGSGFMNGVDLTAHSTAYHTLVNANLNSGQYMLNIQKAGDNTYHLFTTFNVQEGTIDSYFCDEGVGSDYLVMKSIVQTEAETDGSAEWYICNLDASTTKGAFGANAKEKYVREGKYYTTMYADFAYQCLDGVNAYYLNNGDEGEPNYDEDYKIVYLTKIEDGKVPANMAVVLECENVQNAASNAPAAVTNRLLPLFSDDPSTPAENSIINEKEHFLKGYVSVNGSKVTNDKKSKFVLSYINQLAFYLFNNDYMTPNKAYLDLSTLQESGASLSISFDKTGLSTNGITLVKGEKDNANTPVYDLLGRKITGKLPKGIYVRNGRKFVVK